MGVEGVEEVSAAAEGVGGELGAWKSAQGVLRIAMIPRRMHLVVGEGVVVVVVEVGVGEGAEKGKGG